MTELALERAQKIKGEIERLKELYENINNTWHGFVFDKGWCKVNIHEFLKLLTDTPNVSIELLRELRFQRLENI